MSRVRTKRDRGKRGFVGQMSRGTPSICYALQCDKCTLHIDERFREYMFVDCTTGSLKSEESRNLLGTTCAEQREGGDRDRRSVRVRPSWFVVRKKFEALLHHCQRKNLAACRAAADSASQSHACKSHALLSENHILFLRGRLEETKEQHRNRNYH